MPSSLSGLSDPPLQVDWQSAFERLKQGRASDPSQDKLWDAGPGTVWPRRSGPAQGDVDALPFGDPGDIVSQLALLLAPYLKGAVGRMLSAPSRALESRGFPPGGYPPRGASLPPEETAALRAQGAEQGAVRHAPLVSNFPPGTPSLVEQMQADEAANTARFAQWKTADTSQADAQAMALRQWTMAHYPETPWKWSPMPPNLSPDPTVSQEALAMLMQKHGWNPPTARPVVDLGTGKQTNVPPPSGLQTPVHLEDIIRGLLGGRQ